MISILVAKVATDVTENLIESLFMQKILAYLGFAVTSSEHALGVVVSMAEKLSADHLQQAIIALTVRAKAITAATAEVVAALAPTVEAVVAVVDPAIIPAVTVAVADVATVAVEVAAVPVPAPV